MAEPVPYDAEVVIHSPGNGHWIVARGFGTTGPYSSFEDARTNLPFWQTQVRYGNVRVTAHNRLRFAGENSPRFV